jgi:hypothetical protein
VVINGWAILGGEGSGAEAQSCLEKSEEQFFAGNPHAQLTDDIYADAIMA